MKKSTFELLTGIFMLLGIAATAYLTIKLGAGSLLGRDTYLIEARFANVGGLRAGSNVQLAGVTVGRVESVRIEASDYSAIATLRVESDIQLPTDSIASIKTSGLIGDKYVSLSPGADETLLAAKEQIFMTESAVDLESLISKITFGNVESSQEVSSDENNTAP
ncbi:MAG: outer membrane lipid asymmetry maintenance protein MlaD [Chthoniobacterales bacterium]